MIDYRKLFWDPEYPFYDPRSGFMGGVITFVAVGIPIALVIAFLAGGH